MAQNRKKYLLGAGYAGLQAVTKLQKKYLQMKQKSL